MLVLLSNIIFCSVIMSVLSLLFIGISSALKNVWSARSRRLVWIFIMLGFILGPLPFSFKSEYGIPIASAEYSGSQGGSIRFYSPSGIHSAYWSTELITVIFIIWFIGFAIYLLSCYVRQYRFEQYALRVSVACPDELRLLAMEAAEALGTPLPTVRYLSGIKTPMLCSLRSPIILIPCSRYSKDEFSFIMRHELTHLKQRDLQLKLLSLICLAVHWFNPLVHLVARHIDSVCELACDERVIHGLSVEERKLYCNTILASITRQINDNKPLSPAVATNFEGGKQNLKSRLKMIITAKNKRMSLLVCLFLLLTVTVSSLFSTSHSGLSDGSTYTDTTTVIHYFYTTETTSTFYGEYPVNYPASDPPA